MEKLFHSANPERDAFMANVFNLFSHDIVRCWVRDDQSPYDDLGKATLRKSGASRGQGLDFGFGRRKQAYAVLLKCDPAADKTLSEPAQIKQANTTKTFAMYLDAASHPDKYQIVTSSETYPASGSVLIWSGVDPKAGRTIKKAFNFHDLLSLEQIIADLIVWHNRDFHMLLDHRVAWSHDLFKGLRRG